MNPAELRHVHRRQRRADRRAVRLAGAGGDPTASSVAVVATVPRLIRYRLDRQRLQP